MHTLSAVKGVQTSPFGFLTPTALPTHLVCYIVSHAHHPKRPLASTMKMLTSTVVSLSSLPCVNLAIAVKLLCFFFFAEYNPSLVQDASVLNYCEFGDNPTDGTCMSWCVRLSLSVFASNNFPFVVSLLFAWHVGHRVVLLSMQAGSSSCCHSE